MFLLFFPIVLFSLDSVQSTIFTDGTTAVKFSVVDHGINSCLVYDVRKDPASTFKNNTEEYYVVDSLSMLEVIHGCQSSRQKTTPTSLHKRSIINILEGIYPGTKWCGRGTVARKYTDLGYFNSTDACCRDHDHCNEFILPGGLKHGVRNDQQYTICSCECDRKLRICLQEVGSITSRAVGSLFFNVVGIKCFKTRPIRVSGFNVGRVADLMSPEAYDQGAKVHSFDEVLAGNVTVIGWLGSLFGGK